MIDNFVFNERVGKSCLNYKYYGAVDVTTTTGSLWWKETTTVTMSICKEFIGYWFFIETGKFTPGLEVEHLVRCYCAANPESDLNQ